MSTVSHEPVRVSPLEIYGHVVTIYFSLPNSKNILVTVVMLGPRPGARKRANKLNVNGLGRSLVNQQKKEKKHRYDSDRYTTDDNPYGSGSTLQSVTEQRPLDELLSTAEMSGKDFTTERTAAIRIVQNPSSEPHADTISKEERDQLIKQHYDNAGKLTVPRRPKWSKDMTVVELDRLEKDAFLAWRRSLATIQENPSLRLAITPFERNIEVWRQLWRVLERSDLVVQIVDARNPLLYRSEDLDTYAKSYPNKSTLLLVNKADLLTDNQRKLWHEYFVSHNINFAFFSAKKAVDDFKQEEEADESKDAGESKDVEGSNKREDLENTTKILSVAQLEDLFVQAAPDVLSTDRKFSQLQIGLLGYPNVGKSSTINALIGAKKVSVSSTPGKTKHFQTIPLTKDIMLCDCPGLVFPNFAQTKGELVCQGVLPIDQLRDAMSPSELVVERIPKQFLEKIYAIRLHTNPVTALDLLETYAKYRGFATKGGGMPDSSRAARIILKDYVNAKLPFVMPPPSYNGTPQDFNHDLFETIIPELPEPNIVDVEPQQPHIPGSAPLTGKLADLQMEEDFKEDELDRDFFAGTNDRGTASVPFHMRKAQGKPSKKHNKGRKAQN